MKFGFSRYNTFPKKKTFGLLQNFQNSCRSTIYVREKWQVIYHKKIRQNMIIHSKMKMFFQFCTVLDSSLLIKEKLSEI